MRLIVGLALLSLVVAQRRRGGGRGGRRDEGITLTPGPDECLYTFTIPNTQLRDTCRTAEVEDLIAELEASNQALKNANDDLKKDIQKIRDDYQSMVDAVHILEAETTSWREIIEWPKLDPRFEPENDTVVFVTDPTYTDCWAAKNDGHTKQGIYNMEPESAALPFLAYCDEDGWNVIQRRFGGEGDETVKFFRNWDEYSGGFGRLSGEFWLGLENIHLLTNQKDYELKVELVGWNNKYYTSYYDNFHIQSETVNYALDVGNYTSGNYKDVLTNLNGRPFSTFDNDNDDWPSANCANYYQGAWWLDQCGFDPHRPWCEGTGCMSWGDRNIKKSIMKIRPMSAKGTPETKKKNKVIRIKKVKRKRNRGNEYDEY